MSGIVFVKTRDLAATGRFYAREIGMETWLEQEDIVLLKHGNFILGLHQAASADTAGLITFFYRTRGEVDRMHARMGGRSDGRPVVNDRYGIYHFFATDPEGRRIEFQAFLHPLRPYLDGGELLSTRRSVREFEGTAVPDELLTRVFEMCRHSPTSCNSQSYFYVVVRDRAKTAWLAALRGHPSAPIGRAPLAVAVCADGDRTKRPEQDACIAAYHFMLAAWLQGLGTCWIAAMDRDDVKERLGVRQADHVATITPVGFPSAEKGAPERRAVREFVRGLEE